MNITTFSVTASAATAVVATSQCQNIEVGESQAVSGWPTTAFWVTKNIGTPTNPVASAQRQRVAGLTYIFSDAFGNLGRPFNPGETAGWVQLISGASATTFVQDET